MKHTWARSIGFLALAFVVCVALFTALKLVATAIPESALHDSIERSLVTLKEEGGNYHELVARKEATQLDNFTSALILNMCVNDRADGIEAAFADWYYTSEAGSSDQVAPLESLLTQDIPDDDPRWSSYARYWNGAVVLLKPLLVFLDLAGIRLLFTIVTIVLLLLDAILLARSTSIYSGFAFAVPFTAICLPAATMSLSLAFTFMISAASTLFVIVSFKRRACNVHRWVVPFFLFGAATAFFDMLCTPLITLGIPLAVLVYLGADRWKASGVRDTVVFLLAVVVCWALGYGLLWVAKWVIATIVLGWDVIGNALFAFTYRTSSIGTSDKALRPWSAARINFDALLS